MRLSSLFLLSVPLSPFFTAAQSLLDDLSVEEQPAGRNLAPVGRLHPKRLASKREFGVGYHHTLHHAEEHHESAAHYHSILDFDFRWPAILTSDHDEISGVSCGADSLDVHFSRAEDFAAAEKWPTPMLLITDRFDALCRPTKELHAIYVESILEADATGNTLRMDAFGIDWATAAHEYYLKLGHVGHAQTYSSAISKRANALAPHFTVNPGFNWDESTKSVANPTLNMFGGQNDEQTASYSLDCLNCTFHGDFTLTLETGSILADLALDAILLVAKAAHAAEKAIVKVFSKIGNTAAGKRITDIVHSVSNIASKAFSVFGKIMKSGKKKHGRRDLFLRAAAHSKGSPVQSKVALKQALALLDAESRPQIERLARLARKNGIAPSTAVAPLLKLIQIERQQLIKMASQISQQVSPKSRRSTNTLASRGIAGSPSLSVNGNLYGNLDFALTLQGELTVASKSKTLFNKGIPSLTLPKIAVIGPYVKLVAVAELRFEANITLTTGVGMSWPGISAYIPLGGGSNSMTTGKHVSLDWHKPQLVLNEAKATIGSYLEPQLLFGIDLLINNKEYSAGVGFKSGLEYSLGYGDDDCGDGIMARLDFANEFNALIYGKGGNDGKGGKKSPTKTKKKKGKRSIAESLDTSLFLVKRAKGKGKKEEEEPTEIPLWTADPVHLWHSCASLTPTFCPAMINGTQLAVWDDHTNTCLCTAGTWAKAAKTCVCPISGQSISLDASNTPQCVCLSGTSLVTAADGSSICAPDAVKIINPITFSSPSASPVSTLPSSLSASELSSMSTDPDISSIFSASASASYSTADNGSSAASSSEFTSSDSGSASGAFSTVQPAYSTVISDASSQSALPSSAGQSSGDASSNAVSSGAFPESSAASSGSSSIPDFPITGSASSDAPSASASSDFYSASASADASSASVSSDFYSASASANASSGSGWSSASSVASSAAPTATTPPAQVKFYQGTNGNYFGVGSSGTQPVKRGLATLGKYATTGLIGGSAFQVLPAVGPSAMGSNSASAFLLADVASATAAGYDACYFGYDNTINNGVTGSLAITPYCLSNGQTKQGTGPVYFANDTGPALSYAPGVQKVLAWLDDGRQIDLFMTPSNYGNLVAVLSSTSSNVLSIMSATYGISRSAFGVAPATASPILLPGIDQSQNDLGFEKGAASPWLGLASGSTGLQTSSLCFRGTSCVMSGQGAFRIAQKFDGLIPLVPYALSLAYYSDSLATGSSCEPTLSISADNGVNYDVLDRGLMYYVSTAATWRTLSISVTPTASFLTIRIEGSQSCTGQNVMIDNFKLSYQTNAPIVYQSIRGIGSGPTSYGPSLLPAWFPTANKGTQAALSPLALGNFRNHYATFQKSSTSGMTLTGGQYNIFQRMIAPENAITAGMKPFYLGDPAAAVKNNADFCYMGFDKADNDASRPALARSTTYCVKNGTSLSTSTTVPAIFVQISDVITLPTNAAQSRQVNVFDPQGNVWSVHTNNNGNDDVVFVNNAGIGSYTLSTYLSGFGYALSSMFA